MNLRDLTEEEKALLRAEGIDPAPLSVRYQTEHDLHLRNRITGTDIIVYWGLKKNA